MYEIQRRKGRLLTASSLALAAILTMGASTGWAQTSNVTKTDGGTVNSSESAADKPITITGTGADGKADITVAGGEVKTSVLGANGTADTIKVTAATLTDKLTIVGAGGNLVENTDTKSAINLAIGLGTTVEVTGKGGTVGDVIGAGAGTGGSTFNVIGKAGENTVVTGKTLSGVTFTFDPATVNFDDIKDSAGTVKNQTTLNVKNDITNSTGSALLITADDRSVIKVGGNVVSTNLTADNSSTITVGKNVENTLATKLELNADNGSTITVKGDLVDTSKAGFTSVVQNGGQVTIEGKIANLTSQVGTSGIIDLGPRTNVVTAGMKTLGILGSDGKVVTDWGTANKVLLNNGTVNASVSNQPISSLMTINRATAITDNSSFIVGKTTPATATAEFAAGSLLMVDAANGGRLDVSASTGSKDAIIDDDASLYIVNAQRGDTTILSGFTGGITATTTGNDLTEGWGKNLRFDSRLFQGGTVKVNTTGDAVSVEGNYIGAGNAYANGRISSGTANMIDSLYTGRDNNVDSTNAGIKFVSRAVNENYLDTNQNNGKKVVTTLEGAAAMASTAGVQTSTYSISNTLAENYNARLSYLRDTAPAAGSGEAGTIGVWINPFYNSTDVDGVRIGRHDGEYEFNYGGGTIGLDSNISDNFRLGLAFSAGGGDTESKGSNFNKTESDFDFWGLGVYGSYTNGMFGLTGDVSYSSTSYDIDQRIPGLGMNKLTADVDTDAFTVGLTGEYRFLTSNNLNIIPHLGLRYTNLKTDSYRVKEKGVGDVFKISSETQNIWTIPLGVTFTGEVATSSDWVIQPKADLGVIFAAGDLDADSKFRINGTNYGGRVTADDVVDAVTFNGLVGLKAENCDGFSVGLDYNFKASDNLTSHGVTGTIRYDF